MRLRTIGVVVTVALELLAAPLAAAAQQSGKVWRIGLLGPRPEPASIETFRGALRDRGQLEAAKR